MKIAFLPLVIFPSLVFGIASAEARTVRYELTATRGTVNLSGKKSVDFALMLNGGIPAPTLEFTEGDDAEIVLKNGLTDEELSVHWHGILLPPEMDGVPYVNTPPIHPGQSFTFRFKIRQHGTYWYHSHTNVQEQKGLYGAIVIHPREKSLKVDRDVVAVISDWSDEDARDILKNLKKDGDYYLSRRARCGRGSGRPKQALSALISRTSGPAWAGWTTRMWGTMLSSSTGRKNCSSRTRSQENGFGSA